MQTQKKPLNNVFVLKTKCFYIANTINGIMPLVGLFSSEKRLKVLERLFYNQGAILKVRAIARDTKLSPALVSSTIAVLRKEGIVRNSKLDYSNALVRALKILLNIKKIGSARLIQKTRELFPGCSGLGVYGSWANGTNNSESDIDLWIKSNNENNEKTSKTRRVFKQKLGTEANVIILTKKRLKELKEKDFVFYCMLHNSFLLWGEGI